MLKDNAIYNSSFRFQNINFNNVNDIYFAINIIAVIAITLFETFIIAALILELVIIIVINVDIIIVVIIVAFDVFKRSIFKLIAFGFNIKKRLAMSASFNKS